MQSERNLLQQQREGTLFLNRFSTISSLHFSERLDELGGCRVKLGIFSRSHREDEHRQGPRLKVFFPGTLVWAGNERRAHLIDLSLKGAKVSCATIPATGSRVQFVWEGDVLAGRCIWAQGNLFGMAFDLPISQDRLSTMVI